MRYIVLIFIFIISLHSEVIKAKYDVSYGLFGKVGKSEAVLIKKDNRYKIEISAKAQGFAKVLRFYLYLLFDISLSIFVL